MKKRYTPTPEQIERRKKLRELCRSIAAMSPEHRQTLADQTCHNIITCEQRQLSVFNQVFIVKQGGTDCTIVGGYQQWKKAGRQVNKGEHGFAIWVPTGAPKQKEGEQQQETESEEDVSFMLATVFDVSQTSETEQQQTAPQPAITEQQTPCTALQKAA
jgi:hypothetical protein